MLFRYLRAGMRNIAVTSASARSAGRRT